MMNARKGNRAVYGVLLVGVCALIGWSAGYLFTTTITLTKAMSPVYVRALLTLVLTVPTAFWLRKKIHELS